MTSSELREKFIRFFVEKDHKELAPASLIPENDPSVLFTTAGMQQFKKYYTNPEEAPAKNVVTCQPCIRTSDIDLVGDDTHLTFFEMLGNFSFGGYGKQEAIKYAWNFLTDVLGIDKQRISTTFYDYKKASGPLSILFEETDEESHQELKKYLDDSKITSQGDDNFWSLGTVGSPGGPTVEFYIDNIEVWNIVFNEAIFEGNVWHWFKVDPHRKYSLGIDTGMGLERILTVKNESKNVYETDLFETTLDKISEILPLNKEIDLERMRILADHMRSSVMLIREGLNPGKNKRESVLRKLIRSMVDYSGFKEYGDWVRPIAKEVIAALVKNKDYIDLKEKEETIIAVLQNEVDNYREVLIIAEKNLVNKREFSEEDAANLHQTLGIPFDMYNEYSMIRTRRKLSYDKFLEFEKKHQDLSRTASTGMFKGGLVGESDITTRMHTATHLLLKALQEVLGPDVHQRGSNINEERIRFDFSYPQALTDEQIKKVEEIVNQKIAENLPVTKKETTVEEAKALGAEAQFLSKYGQHDAITMYSIGNYSNELCGGPHVKSTAEIGKLKIIKEESSSSGVRRIRAILE